MRAPISLALQCATSHQLTNLAVGSKGTVEMLEVSRTWPVTQGLEHRALLAAGSIDPNGKTSGYQL